MILRRTNNTTKTKPARAAGRDNQKTFDSRRIPSLISSCENMPVRKGRTLAYLTPTSAAEALAYLSETRAHIIAGCTDFYPNLQQGHVPENILDITRLDGFRGIARTAQGWRIGAATSWSDVLRAPLPPAFDALKLAAREVGSIQIQNRGTVAGNICNASPAADGVPPLLALDAEVEIISQAGKRVLPLGNFITGVRQTDLRRDEMVSAILIPQVSSAAKSAFLKLGSRAYLVISIVMVAVVAEVTDGRIADLRVAVGSCSPVARRLSAWEGALKGTSAEELQKKDCCARELPVGLDPISDVRGSADYRLDAAGEMCRRAIRQACCGD